MHIQGPYLKKFILLLGSSCCYSEKFKSKNCFNVKWNCKFKEYNRLLFVFFGEDSVHCKQIFTLVHVNNEMVYTVGSLEVWARVEGARRRGPLMPLEQRRRQLKHKWCGVEPAQSGCSKETGFCEIELISTRTNFCLKYLFLQCGW